MSYQSLETLQTRLAEAREARHKLLTGAQEVSVTLYGYGGTSYTQSNLPALERYIQELETQIARKTGAPRRGVLRIGF